MRWLQGLTVVRVLAVLGMLVHAGLWLRHGIGALTSVSLADADFLCVGGMGAAQEQPAAPGKPLPPAAPCPACAVGECGAAILPPALAHIALPAAPSRPLRVAPRFGARARVEVPRPGRGPPMAHA